MTKIEKRNDKINPFGGINFVLDLMNKSGLVKLIDDQLGSRPKQAMYSYSDIFFNLWSVFFCGGDCAEDINEHLRESIENVKDGKAANSDTILGVLKSLKTDNETVVSTSKKEYTVNRHDGLNQLNVSIMTTLELLKGGCYYDFDYDNEVLKTEKYDAVATYKKYPGYFPGMATIEGMPVYFENRDGNMNVKTDQAQLLERAYKLLNDNNIKINRSRMDAGSYSKEIIEIVEKYSKLFYIRANRCAALTKQLIEKTNWETVEINNIIYEVCTIDYQPFGMSRDEVPKTYRLVVSREKTKNLQADLFTGDNMKYRSILTNDTDSSEKEIIEYYNKRGTEEKTIDILNNDFGWGKMPFSYLAENTVFLTLMMICLNIFTWIKKKVSTFFPEIKVNSRMKRFIYRFITVPVQWKKRSRYVILRVFSSKPYEKLSLS